MAQTPTATAIKARLQTLVGPARSGGERDLADLLGESKVNVHRYVRGGVIPPHDFLAKVADRYNVTLDWLYGRSTTGGVKDAEQAEPAWARRLDARMRSIERRLATGPSEGMSEEQLVRVIERIEARLALPPSPRVAGARGSGSGPRDAAGKQRPR